MRVLMLNYEYPPLGGGAATACKYILRELSKKDIDVDLVTSSASNIFETEHIGQNVTIYKLAVGKNSVHYWTQREILTYSWKARRFTKQLLKDNQYDLCHAFFGIPCGAIAYLFRKKMPYIVSLRGSDVPGFNKRFSFQYVLLKPIIRRVWRSASAVIALSEGGRRDALKTEPKCVIDIIHNGIDTEQFKPTEGKSSGGKVRILCVSRLIERKGIDYLIRSAPSLRNRFGDAFEICIVGEGNVKQELKQLALELEVEDSVNFMGYIEHDNLPPVCASSDIFVLPSMSETFCNARLEAMACGLPIITTDTGGTKELINGNGIVIPSQDSNAISEAISELIEDPMSRRRMGEVSAELAATFGWAAVTEQYLRIYERTTSAEAK